MWVVLCSAHNPLISGVLAWLCMAQDTQHYTSKKLLSALPPHLLAVEAGESAGALITVPHMPGCGIWN